MICPRYDTRWPASCLLWLLLAAPLAARSPGTVVLADGAPFDATLVDVGADGNFRFMVGDQSKLVPRGGLVRWGTYSDNDRDAYVLLTDNSLVVAETVEVSDDSVTIEADLWGRLKISRQCVRGMVLAPPGDALQRDRLWYQVQQATGIDDRVLLLNGDQVTGRVLAMSDARSPLRVVRRPGEQPLTINCQDVTAVVFTPALLDSVTRPPLAVQVGLRDGTLLAVESIAVRGAQIELGLVAGAVVRTEAASFWDAVRFLQPESTRVRYLSDLKASSYKHVPFLQLSWPWARDRNALGGRLRTTGAVALKGIGMHSAASLAYELDERCRSFCAELALDEQAGSRGSVTFQVFLQPPANDGGDSWVLVYEGPIVRGGQPPQPISVDLSGAKQLALIVGFADRGDQLDYANWLNARLILAPE